jgi:hypothetical protein
MGRSACPRLEDRSCLLTRGDWVVEDRVGPDREALSECGLPRRVRVGLEYSIVVVICVSSLHRGLSGGDVVLVRESAEDVSSADPVLSEVDLRWPGVSLSRCELAHGTVGPDGVVMPQILGQHLTQVVLVDDQQPVEQLPAQGTDHPFADSVAPHRQLHLIRVIGTDASG